MTQPHERFPVDFDFEAYCRDRKGEIPPRKSFVVDWQAEDNERIVVENLERQVDDVCRAADGKLAHPYVVPGGPYSELWDWDAYFTSLGICAVRPEYVRGSLENFLDLVDSDGRAPKLVTPGHVNYSGHPYPLLAQWTVLVLRSGPGGSGDPDWVAKRWPVLLRVRDWYDAHWKARRGLYRVGSWATGQDNDPVTYGRAPGTVAPVDHNTLQWRELRAMALLAELLGRQDEAARFTAEAADLLHAMRTYMWDPIDGLYYALDMADRPGAARQGVTWEIPIKLRSSASLYVLWAGIPTPGQAERIIREHVLNPAEFLSDYGLRSLAANERMYNNEPMGNPSNWQGPVWAVTTAIVAYGLARHGYHREALDLAGRLVATFAADFRTNGLLHECYHAETGAPVMKPGFQSWNLMAIRLLHDLRSRVDPADLSPGPLS